VRAGQIVARIDPSPYQSQLEAARAAVAQARAEAARMSTALADARTKFNRGKELAAGDLIPQAELDTAGITMAQAAADLRKSEADIRVAQALADQALVSLGHTVIRSPIDGIVVNRNVNVGQTVAVRLESPVLFTIADLRKMKLLVEIDEGEVGGVRTGTPVTFQVESLGPEKFEGTVSEVRLQPYAEQAAVATTGTTPGNSAGSSSVLRSATPASPAGSTPVPTSGSTPASPPGSTPGSPSGSTAASSSGSPAASTSASTASSGPAAPGVVTYTAVVNVNNQLGRLTPGGTAVVNLTGSQRHGVVRIPNNALSFRPDPGMLKRTGQAEPQPDPTGPSGTVDADRRRRIAHVWRYDNNRFTPVTVEIGVADDQWTELLSGPLRPGDQLVTRAVVARQGQSARNPP
jgi:HlyD family secretion protein